MLLKLTPTAREMLADIATITEEEEAIPVHPTLYKLWDDCQPIPTALDLPESEWVSILGDLMTYYEESKATDRLLLQACNAATDPVAFCRACEQAAGLIAPPP